LRHGAARLVGTVNMRVEDLETPVPVIDLDRVEHNLTKMQDYCNQHGLRLRPHIKTHKIPTFARRQIELGASGIACQKLGEAEIMVDAGLDDILISYPLIGPAKALRLAALARRAKMTVAVDNPLALETAVRAARAAGGEISVLVEFDSGNQRTGVVSVDQALDLAREIIDADGVRFEGLMTYPSTEATASFVAAAKRLFADAGIAIAAVSGGGTPGAWHAHDVVGLTEVRVGTYIYHDRATVAAGAATLDECALHLHATVVSRPTGDRAVIDAGSKSLSSDLVSPSAGPGYGLILGYRDAVIERLNEEHGVIDVSRCQKKPMLGERIRIVPNHVCVVSNLHDEVVLTRDGRVIDTWRVAARGKTL
jgi:D-serine deaminase-like pyridoxal phosphate-dependent protein